VDGVGSDPAVSVGSSYWGSAITPVDPSGSRAVDSLLAPDTARSNHGCEAGSAALPLVGSVLLGYYVPTPSMTVPQTTTGGSFSRIAGSLIRSVLILEERSRFCRYSSDLAPSGQGFRPGCGLHGRPDLDGSDGAFTGGPSIQAILRSKKQVQLTRLHRSRSLIGSTNSGMVPCK
jgi:hypothetical protein